MMDYNNFGKLSRKDLMALFEKERKELLKAGMSEAGVHRLHYGEEYENGHGGDYGVWLAERRQTRSDHKYAPGSPIAFDPDGHCIEDDFSELDDVEFYIDLKSKLKMLTELQRFCFIEICLKDRKYRDIANECGKSTGTIINALKGAKRKIKNIF